MAHIIIQCSTGMLQARPGSYSIYDFLTDKGAGHDEAASVQGWSELAGIGEEYELDGFHVFVA